MSGQPSIVDNTYEVTKASIIFENLKAGPVSIIPLYLSAQNLEIDSISLPILFSAKNSPVNGPFGKVKIPLFSKT